MKGHTLAHITPPRGFREASGSRKKTGKEKGTSPLHNPWYSTLTPAHSQFHPRSLDEPKALHSTHTSCFAAHTWLPFAKVTLNRDPQMLHSPPESDVAKMKRRNAFNKKKLHNSFPKLTPNLGSAYFALTHLALHTLHCRLLKSP